MSISIYEQLFELVDQLCQRYISLNPISIRKERAIEVLLLVERVKIKNKRETKNVKSTGARKSVIKKYVDENTASGGWY